MFLDNFPGSGTQVRLLLNRLAPACAVHAIELMVDRQLRGQRVDKRRVCLPPVRKGPIHDPRIPARTRRYEEQVTGIRAAFAEAGITPTQLDSGRPVATLISDLRELMAADGVQPPYYRAFDL